MALDRIDLAAFLVFLGIVVGVSLYAGRREDTTADYFLAGRNLPWWLIGISLIASNISSEHFIGMSGEGLQTGLAIAAFEWIAAIALVFVALVLLPRFLQAGIYTLPEYLEFRFGPTPRVIMAAYLMIVYVVVGLAGILYAGSLALTSIFGLDLAAGVWAIGLLAGGYTIYGGLKAVVWSDMLQGVALLGGGAVLFFLAMEAVGGFGAFLSANEDRLHLMLPADHPTLPWTIYIMGIWVPNIAYWGLNQFISQRALAARSLAEGQKGVIFAAFLKLLIPFLIVMPGIAAYQLYAGDIAIGDQAYPTLMADLLPTGLRGVMFAALFGAVMSSLDSMLNSASTIFTLDIYSRHVVKKELEPRRAVRIGRIATGVFVVIGCLLAPQLASVGGDLRVHAARLELHLAGHPRRLPHGDGPAQGPAAGGDRGPPDRPGGVRAADARARCVLRLAGVPECRGGSVRPLEPGDGRRVARPSAGGGPAPAAVRCRRPRTRALGEVGGRGRGDPDRGALRGVLVGGAASNSRRAMARPYGSPSATNSGGCCLPPMATTMNCFPSCMYDMGPPVVPASSSVSQITSPVALS